MRYNCRHLINQIRKAFHFLFSFLFLFVRHFHHGVCFGNAVFLRNLFFFGRVNNSLASKTDCTSQMTFWNRRQQLGDSIILVWKRSVRPVFVSNDSFPHSKWRVHRPVWQPIEHNPITLTKNTPKVRIHIHSDAIVALACDSIPVIPYCLSTKKKMQNILTITTKNSIITAIDCCVFRTVVNMNSSKWLGKWIFALETITCSSIEILLFLFMFNTGLVFYMFKIISVATDAPESKQIILPMLRLLSRRSIYTLRINRSVGLFLFSNGNNRILHQ